MKVTETLLLLGLGGVIAYLALSKKSDGGSAKSLGGGSAGGSDFDSPSTRALEQIDVIETKPPINVTVNVPQAPSSTEDTGTTTPPTTPTQEPESEPATPTAAFVNSRRRDSSNNYRERMVILDNTNFPITQAYRDDLDVDNY